MAVSTLFLMDEVAKTLNDKDFVYWTSEDLLNYLNEAMVQTVILKPDASVTAKEYQLSTGVRQSLPDGSAAFVDAAAGTLPKAMKLVKVVMNMGTDGLTPGRAISIIDMDMLAAIRPDWASKTGSPTAIHYMFSEADPKSFWVHPPQPATNQGYVFVVYNSFPTPCVAYSETEYVPLSDEYAQTLMYYMLFKAYSKDTDSADANKSLQYYDAFKTSLGLQQNVERNEDPNYKDTDVSPSIDRR